MARVGFTPAARDDLLEIWIYMGQDDPQAADRLYDRFEERCEALARHPELGPARPDAGAGIRALVVGNYVVLFRIAGGDIEVIRVLHGSRVPPGGL